MDIVELTRSSYEVLARAVDAAEENRGGLHTAGEVPIQLLNLP